MKKKLILDGHHTCLIGVVAGAGVGAAQGGRVRSHRERLRLAAGQGTPVPRLARDVIGGSGAAADESAQRQQHINRARPAQA